MWLVAVSASPILAVLLFSKHYRGKVVSLCQRAQAWILWLMRQEVCPQSVHAFVFCQCTHGKVDSVLETYDLYHSMYPSLSIGPQIGAQLDEVVRRLQPFMALELGMHCGYSSFEVLTSSSSDAILLLPGRVGSHEDGFSLVLMDHDQGQYLTDLQSLEREGLLRFEGCSIVFMYRERGAGRDIREYIQTRGHCYCINIDTRFMVEVCYQNTGVTRAREK
ncbi:hypothetical protein NL108_000569 [Boleophthalmus pectinirostris]|nr:hypothetical protein NL108_000569 [Boleophthalmus pectinirostris]